MMMRAITEIVYNCGWKCKSSKTSTSDTTWHSRHHIHYKCSPNVVKMFTAQQPKELSCIHLTHQLQLFICLRGQKRENRDYTKTPVHTCFNIRPGWSHHKWSGNTQTLTPASDTCLLWQLVIGFRRVMTARIAYYIMFTTQLIILMQCMIDSW